MQILTQLVFSGIALGMIYAVIAFGYQLTFATSDTLNFGQGEALMLGALVGLTLVGLGVNYWLMIPIVCVFGAIQGAIVERIGVRPALKIKSEFGWIMSTIALGIIFRNVAENVWGRDMRPFPSPLPEAPLHFLGANVRPMEIVVAVGAVLMMAAVELFNRKTIWGKAVVATFNDREAARLMGINTSLVITFSYALSSISAAMAAQLGLKAFAVAIIGGLTSGMGIIIGGIILGIAEKLTGFYLSTGYQDVPGLVLLLIVLAVRPAGLFGKTAIKKV
jgi:branched-chain amino acid transport system permease protein